MQITRRPLFLSLAASLAIRTARAAALPQDRFFVTSDGVRLHYTESGPPGAHTIVFVPGWTMPAWIWERQIAFFSSAYRVIAFDPRGQGDSAVPAEGYDQTRRGQDIAELLARLGPAPALLVGWSLGVLDSLAYVHTHGDAHIAGLVLVDNSVGENPPPPPPQPHRLRRPEPYPVRMENFVRSMFRQKQPEAFLQRLTDAALRTPPAVSAQLLAYPVPRSYWREAVYATNKPVLYTVRPGLAGQAANLQANHPAAESVIFADAGHALFIDDANRFNAVMQGFIRNLVWP
jgi:microsomal epoxide hydrolase